MVYNGSNDLSGEIEKIILNHRSKQNFNISGPKGYISSADKFGNSHEFCFR